jgi:acyl-CoA reductase-like NAD-dependent aldehyde dehydrogenase
MLVEHVPPRMTKAFARAIIPGYDGGPVNQDAIVDGDHGSSRRGRLTRTDAVRVPVDRQVARAEWAHESEEEKGRPAEMAQFVLQCWRRVPSLAQSRSLMRVSERLAASGRKLADDIVRETGKPVAQAECAAARAADQLLRYAAIAANETELALTRYTRKATGVVLFEPILAIEAGPALAAGWAAVIKSALKAPQSSVRS